MEEQIIENEEIMETEGTDEGSSTGVGLGILIGSGLTLAIIAGGKKLKKVWTNHKAKKEQEAVIDAECKEVDEEIDQES